MNKYLTILDISQADCYKNINARLLYLHLACRMDIQTNNYQVSIRRLALESGMSISAVRHALQALERDDLIVTTQVATQVSTQVATQVHLVRYNELRTINDTGSDTQSDTQSDTHKNNKNKKSFTLTNARESVKGWVALVAGELRLGADPTANLCDDFLRRMELKGKEWESESDCLAHLLSWCEKAIPRNGMGTTPRKSIRQADEESRQAEYERAREADAMRDQREKAWEEVCKVYRWWKDFEEKKNEKGAAFMRQAYEQLRQQYRDKYGGDGAQ